tara:strand:+ start:265 stop:1335 length:1071 start_codon:yes stop_codon:yes gene_type:complete
MLKKKICLVTPSLHAGGMERVISELGNCLALQDDLEIVLIQYGNSKKFYSVSAKIVHEIIPFKTDSYSKLGFTFKSLFFLRNTIKKHKPDVVLSFGEYYNSFVLFALLGFRLKIFISDRSRPGIDLGTIHNFLRKYLYRNAAGIIAQTSKAKDFIFKTTGHKNICIIGNPIQSHSETVNERDNYVLTVGRLIKSKNVDYLIDLFADSKTEGWQLIIIGDGPEMEYLKKYSSERGLIERVKFMGIIKNVQKYYQKSKIFLFASDSEGFPNALAEAMSFSLPSIAYDCIAGPSDLIEDGFNGYLVPLKNRVEYKEKFEFLLSDKELRTKMGAIARQSIKKFDREAIAEKYLKFIINEN